MSKQVPALVGKLDAAQIIGVSPHNFARLPGLPSPIPGTGAKAPKPVDGMEVTATPLWRRQEIEKFAKARRERKRAAKDVA